MSELKILITGDEKQATAALDRVKSGLAGADQAARKSAEGFGWNKRESLQMAGAAQQAAFSMGNTSASGRVLTRSLGEVVERLGELNTAGKLNVGQLKALAAGMAISGVIMAASYALEAYGKKLKEAADNAEALMKSSADLTTTFMANYMKSRMTEQARAYDEGRLSFRAYNTWLLSEEQRHYQAAENARKAAMGETDSKRKADLVTRYKTEYSLFEQFDQLQYQTEKQHQDKLKKLAEDKANKTIAARRKETEAKIKLAVYESEVEQAIADFEMETQEAVAQYQLELTEAKMQMALTYGQVIGDYAAQAANGQMSVEQAAANATIDIFADLLTKKLTAWAAMNAGMGNFLKAGMAMAAIATVKSILKHSVGGGAAIAPVSIVPSGTTLPAVPGAGSGGRGATGGGATGGGGGERGAPVSSQIGEITIYQSIVIHGNVLASNFYRTVLEASAAGARAGGR